LGILGPANKKKKANNPIVMWIVHSDIYLATVADFAALSLESFHKDHYPARQCHER
jgi:hypothetical protein